MTIPRLTLKTPPDTLAVDEQTVREHLRLDAGVEDFLVLSYVKAATAYLDGWTGILGRALMPQVWTMTLPAFPAGCIGIPFGPVTGIVAVTYKDGAGAVQTIPPSDYLAFFRNDSAHLNALTSWPTAGDYPDAVTVEFEAGAGCPEPVGLAIMMMVAAVFDGRSGGEMLTPAVQALIAPWRAVPL